MHHVSASGSRYLRTLAGYVALVCVCCGTDHNLVAQVGPIGRGGTSAVANSGGSNSGGATSQVFGGSANTGADTSGGEHLAVAGTISTGGDTSSASNGAGGLSANSLPQSGGQTSGALQTGRDQTGGNAQTGGVGGAERTGGVGSTGGVTAQMTLVIRSDNFCACVLETGPVYCNGQDTMALPLCAETGCVRESMMCPGACPCSSFTQNESEGTPCQNHADCPPNSACVYWLDATTRAYVSSICIG